MNPYPITGIANRAIRPTLGIVDPENILTMPERVTAYSGFDVLCHAIESYTALPYTERGPAPENPKFRPAYQVRHHELLTSFQIFCNI